MTSRIRIWTALAVAFVGVGIAIFQFDHHTSHNAKPILQDIVINEAAHTLLYLPVYHAIERGYFRDEGLEVSLVTGGTATNAVAAIVSGDADVAVADPMYAPISQSKGA